MSKQLIPPFFLFILISFFFIGFISPEQILWDNDSNITIYDSWYDIDGSPLTGQSCSWSLYNPNNSLNQSGKPSELRVGLINFTINKLPSIGIYPLLVNCTKSGYNGTSSLSELKIIDELSEEYKTRLVNIGNDTSKISIKADNISEIVSDMRFILKVNTQKFNFETYEVTPAEGEIKRVRLLISSNAIEGDPTARIYVPVENKEDMDLRNPDNEPINFEFKKDVNGNSYIKFGAIAVKCEVTDEYTREYVCKQTTYYLVFFKDVETSLIQPQVQEEQNLKSLFVNLDYKTKTWIIIGFVILSLFLFISIVLAIVILEKVSKNKQTTY